MFIRSLTDYLELFQCSSEYNHNNHLKLSLIASSQFTIVWNKTVCAIYNLVIELVTRTDLERNKFADDVSSFSAVVEGICEDDVLEPVDRLLITIGWHISAIGRIVLALSVDVLNERHLAISKFKSFRCPARPAAAKGNGTNRWRTWNLCSSKYFFEQKHR